MYFTDDNIFHQNLHGYRHGRSTQTALLQMYDRWIKASSLGQVSGVVLLDLSAAFDLVDHCILNTKLQIYDFDQDTRDWIQSYLRGRKQSVWIDNCYSSFLDIEVGVPQGSNLGPLFFLIYYNDLPYTLDCYLDAYADDSTLTATDKTIEAIGNKLSASCEKVSRWMDSNKLKLNAEKTHILTVGTAQKLMRLPKKLEVHMNDIKLRESDAKCEMLLGISIQSNLKWGQTVTDLKTKLKKRLAGLLKLKYTLPFKVMKAVTEGIFNSILVYCLPVFGGCDKAELHSLQVLQNRAAQIVTRSPPRTNRDLLFDKLHWLSVSQLIAYHTTLAIFKIKSNGCPEYLNAMFKTNTAQGKIQLPKYSIELAEKSFTIRGSKLWNSLPCDLKKEASTGKFKKSLRKWVLLNVSRFAN